VKYEKLLYNKKKKTFSIDNKIYIRLKNNAPTILLPLIRILLINFGYQCPTDNNRLPFIIIYKLCTIINTDIIKTDIVTYNDVDYTLLSDRCLISNEFMVLVYQYKWDIHIMHMIAFIPPEEDEYGDFNDMNKYTIPSIYFMNCNYEVLRSK
jgi:hypothetical protein